jgi:hypothetical protein
MADQVNLPSRGQLQRLSNHSGASEVFFCQRPVRLKGQLDRLAEIGPGLLECRALGVGAGELLDEGDVAFRDRKTAVSSSCMESSG